MILDSTFAAILIRSRIIGGVIPDVTIREVHRDDLIITDHPVETGAAISDHAFKRPVEVEMLCGWSNSTAGTEGYVEAVYAALQALQAIRIPFIVLTGKRLYRNMLIAGLQVQTDQTTESALMVSCRLREVIITSTRQTAVPTASQARPQQTAPTYSRGQVTAFGFASPSVRA